MKRLLILLALISFFTACKDKKTIVKSECEQYPEKCESVLAAKKFFAFKIGSWWLYEEENSGRKDSVYVTDYYNAENYEFDIRMHSTLEAYEYHYWPFYAAGNKNCNETSLVNIPCLYVNRSKGKPGNFIAEGNCFLVNYKKGDYTYAFNIYYPNNKVIVDEIYPTYSIGHIEVGKTVKIHEYSTMVEGIQPTNHYWSENVGLVRKELLDSNQVWNLVDYHIEP